MANSAQARKRARQNTTRRERNSAQRSTMRTAVKNFLKSLENKDADSARTAYQNATSAIDRAVSKGLHHRNRAARLKQRLNNRLRSLNA